MRRPDWFEPVQGVGEWIGFLGGIVVAAAVVALAVLLVKATINGEGSGKLPREPGIIEGTPIPRTAFRSLAYVRDFRAGEVGICTGTVVAPSLVLTAAHCVENPSTGALRRVSGFTVVTGDADVPVSERQTSHISHVIVYPGFDATSDTGDAALLVLNRPTSAPAISLATTRRLGTQGTAAEMVGWTKGYFRVQAYRYERFTSPERLRAHATIQSSELCAEYAAHFSARGQICTLDTPTFRAGACFGESGGPLLVSTGANQLVQVGVANSSYVSARHRLCSTRYPTVFTRVTALAPWLARYLPRLRGIARAYEQEEQKRKRDEQTKRAHEQAEALQNYKLMKEAEEEERRAFG
jgi:secreted trypsin-like serine protease